MHYCLNRSLQTNLPNPDIFIGIITTLTHNNSIYSLFIKEHGKNYLSIPNNFPSNCSYPFCVDQKYVDDKSYKTFGNVLNNDHFVHTNGITYQRPKPYCTLLFGDELVKRSIFSYHVKHNYDYVKLLFKESNKIFDDYRLLYTDSKIDSVHAIKLNTPILFGNNKYINDITMLYLHLSYLNISNVPKIYNIEMLSSQDKDCMYPDYLQSIQFH